MEFAPAESDKEQRTKNKEHEIRGKKMFFHSLKISPFSHAEERTLLKPVGLGL